MRPCAVALCGSFLKGKQVQKECQKSAVEVDGVVIWSYNADEGYWSMEKD